MIGLTAGEASRVREATSFTALNQQLIEINETVTMLQQHISALVPCPFPSPSAPPDRPQPVQSILETLQQRAREIGDRLHNLVTSLAQAS